MYKDIYEIFINANKKIIQNSWEDYTLVIPLDEHNTTILINELNKYIDLKASTVDASVVDVKFFDDYQVIIAEKKIGRTNQQIKLHTNIVYSEGKFTCDVIKGNIGFLPVNRKFIPKFSHIEIPYIVDTDKFPIDIYSFNISSEEIIVSFKINIDAILALRDNISIGKINNNRHGFINKTCIDLLMESRFVEKSLSNYLRYYLKSKKLFLGLKVDDTFINIIDDNISVIVDWHGVKIEISVIAELLLQNSVVSINVKDIHVNNKGMPKKISSVLNMILSTFCLNMHNHGLPENIILNNLSKISEKNLLSVEVAYDSTNDDEVSIDSLADKLEFIEDENINIALSAESVQKIANQIIDSYKINIDILKEIDVEIISSNQMIISNSNIYVSCRYYLNGGGDNILIEIQADECRIMQSYVPNNIIATFRPVTANVSFAELNKRLPITIVGINNDDFVNIKVKI